MGDLAGDHKPLPALPGISRAEDADVRFRLESNKGVPPYLQLVQQVRQAVMSGYLREGDRLPMTREAALAQLAINPNTVSKAYRQLEQEGLVSARPGGDVRDRVPSTPVSPARYASLRRGLEQWLTSADETGLGEEAVAALLAVVRRELAEGGAG